MRFIVVRRTFSEGDCFPLYLWGDWHRLNANCDKGSLIRDRNTIAADPLAMYVHMGDGFDAILHRDKRYDPETVDWSLVEKRDMGRLGEAAIRDRVQFEEPVIDKCVAALLGNHEHTIDDIFDEDLNFHSVRETLRRMGREDLYCPAHAYIRFIFTDHNRHATHVDAQVHHGRRIARYKSTLLNQLLIKLRYWPSVRIMARGHCHYADASYESRVTANDNCTRLKEERAYAVLSGGYLKTYLEDGHCYAEDYDLDPIDIGFQKLLLRPSRDGCKVEAVI